MNKTVGYQIHMIIIRQKQTSYIQTSTQKGKAINLSSCNEINTHTALKTTTIFFKWKEAIWSLTKKKESKKTRKKIQQKPESKHLTVEMTGS